MSYQGTAGFASAQYLEVTAASPSAERLIVTTNPFAWLSRLVIMFGLPALLILGVINRANALFEMEPRLAIFAITACLILPLTVWATVVISLTAGPAAIAKSETLRGIAALFGFIDLAVILRWVYLGFTEMSPFFGVALLLFMPIFFRVAESVSHLEMIGFSCLLLAMGYTGILEEAAWRATHDLRG